MNWTILILILMISFLSCSDRTAEENIGNRRYNKAIEINPDDVKAYYARGIKRFELKNYWEVIQDFERAIKLKPDYAKAYNKRGLAKNILGISAYGLSDFNKAIEINPNFAEAYYNRGITLSMTENNIKPTRGYQDLLKALKLGYKPKSNFLIENCK